MFCFCWLRGGLQLQADSPQFPLGLGFQDTSNEDWFPEFCIVLWVGVVCVAKCSLFGCVFACVPKCRLEGAENLTTQPL